jgi:replicative DNA helicase
MTCLVAAGKPLDLITLSESIESRGKDALEQLGGFAYLAELSKNTPSAANIVAYCDCGQNQPGKATGLHWR